MSRNKLLLVSRAVVVITKTARSPDGKLWATFALGATQPAAQRYCRQLNGDLATVDSASKTKFLIKEFLNTTEAVCNRFGKCWGWGNYSLVEAGGMWIGLHMPGLTGTAPSDKSQYIWYSGAATDTYSNWGRARDSRRDGTASRDQPDGLDPWSWEAQDLGDVPSCVYAISSQDHWYREVGTWDDVGCDNYKPFICEFG